ncbi:MAG: hypothetical protein ABH873_06695 [Candidatus Firestonebacteria bacterium]
MIKILIKSILISLLLYISLISLLKVKISNIDIPEPYNYVDRLPINKTNVKLTIKQTFVANENNFSRIDISFVNDWRKNDDEISFKLLLDVLLSNFKGKNKIPVLFSLYNYKENKLLYKEIFYDLTTKRFKSKSFYFRPIADSKNKIYCYEISFFKSNAFDNMKLLIGDTVDVNNKLYINDNLLKKKSMVFSTYTSSELIGFNTLLDRLSQYKPWFFKKKYLYILIFLYILSNIYLMYYLRMYFRKI